MEAFQQQAHTITVVYSSRKRVFWLMSLIVVLFLLLIGIDVFTIWAFWNRYDIDAGAYVAAVILPICTFLVGWITCIGLYARLRQRGPAISINAQGLYLNFPLRFAFFPYFKQSFVPWEEIEWMSSRKRGMYTWFSLSLKDPAHYWSLYGHGPYRTWRQASLTGAHINITDFSLSLTARQMLQRIEENYHSELLKYEVKIIP